MQEPDETQRSPQDTQAHKLEALGHFAGGIAHDFNNILSIIEGYAATALHHKHPGLSTDEILQKIMVATERGAGLTRQLLAFARQNLDMRCSVSLQEVLRQQEVVLRPLLGENIHLSLPTDTRQLYVRMTSDQLTQVLLNLAINARDAMQGQGKLRISCRKVEREALPPALRISLSDRDFLHLSVSDSGAGIPQHFLPYIFDPFFSTKSTSTAKRGGTGLGLSVVYGIVQQVDGVINVRSVEGEGTTFDLYLPLALPPELTFVERAAAEVPLNTLAGRTVLLAEDEPELRDVLTIVLRGMDMRVLPAANGNDALRVQADYDGEIDFLLTDIVMPGMDGLQLSDLFISERPQANVVLMSGYPFLDGGRDMTIPAEADFIRKPFREERIRQILERALVRKAERLSRSLAAPPSPPPDTPSS